MVTAVTAGGSDKRGPRPRLQASRLVRRCVVKTVFPWVASRANMLYLAARTHNCAAVCLHAAHIAALREFWTDWLPTETPFLPQNLHPRSKDEVTRTRVAERRQGRGRAISDKDEGG